jgi:hypothetical protein
MHTFICLVYQSSFFSQYFEDAEGLFCWEVLYHVMGMGLIQDTFYFSPQGMAGAVLMHMKTKYVPEIRHILFNPLQVDIMSLFFG